MGASQSTPASPAASAPTLSEKQVTALASTTAQLSLRESDGKRKERVGTADLTMDDVKAWHEAFESDPSKAVLGTLLR